MACSDFQMLDLHFVEAALGDNLMGLAFADAELYLDAVNHLVIYSTALADN